MMIDHFFIIHSPKYGILEDAAVQFNLSEIKEAGDRKGSSQDSVMLGVI
jgi:hypothetical protein